MVGGNFSIRAIAVEVYGVAIICFIVSGIGKVTLISDVHVMTEIVENSHWILQDLIYWINS